MKYDFNELTIAEFLKCKSIADLEDDPLQRKIKLLASVSNRTIDEVESLPIDVLTKQIKEFSEVETLGANAKVNMKFKINGRRFIIIWQTQKLTSAQYIDATFFCKDQDKLIYNIHNILASLSIEKNWYGKKLKYDGSNHKEVADLILNNMKIKQAYPILLFFCKYFKELYATTQTYLELQILKTMKEANKEVDKLLVSDMVGLQ
jgi:hypothetical protein